MNKFWILKAAFCKIIIATQICYLYRLNVFFRTVSTQFSFTIPIIKIKMLKENFRKQTKNNIQPATFHA